jgi:hypothetical protein
LWVLVVEKEDENIMVYAVIYDKLENSRLFLVVEKENTWGTGGGVGNACFSKIQPGFSTGSKLD